MRSLPSPAAPCSGVPPPTSLPSFTLTDGWKDSTTSSMRQSPCQIMRRKRRQTRQLNGTQPYLLRHTFPRIVMMGGRGQQERVAAHNKI